MQMQPERRGDHQAARHEGPGGQQQHEGPDRRRRDEEGRDADENVHEALEQQEAPPLMVLGGADGRDDGEDAVGQHVGGEEQHEGEHEGGGRGEGHGAEQDADDAAQGDEPPVPGKRRAHGVETRRAHQGDTRGGGGAGIEGGTACHGFATPAERHRRCRQAPPFAHRTRGARGRSGPSSPCPIPSLPVWE